MIKLSTLTIKILKEILAEYELPTSGNKAQLIERLSNEIASDEINEDVLKHILEKPNNEINTHLTNLSAAIAKIEERLNNPTTTNEPTPTVSLRSNVTPVLDTSLTPNENNERTNILSSRDEVIVNVNTPRNMSTETRNLREIAMILPEFDPTNGNLSAEQFITKINVLSETYGWSSNVMLFASQGKLCGHAKIWLDAQQVFRSFEDFASALINDFPYFVSSADIHIKMVYRVQSRNETIIEYYYAMLALGRHGKLDDRSIIQHMVNGLIDNQLRRTLKTMVFKTCPELLAALNENNDVKQTNGFPNISRDRRYVLSEGKTTFDNKTTNQKTISKVPISDNTNQRSLTCYNCGKPGHISLKCPEPQKKSRCQICSKTTHTTATCPNVKPNVNIVNDGTDTKLMKDVTINGRKIQAFIDPGSSRTLIKGSLAYELAQTTACRIELKGFNAGPYECVEKIQVELGVDNETYPVTLLLVDDVLLADDVLIGRDVLCQQGVKVTMLNGETKIEDVLSIYENNKSDKHDNPKLLELIEKYSNVFANNIKELGRCNKIKMQIELTTTTPVRLKPYRIPFAQRVIVNEIVSELLENNIIQPSTSAYASPTVLVTKKNGEPRLCVDYRCLNKVTKKIPFPMPLIEEQFAQLAGYRYYTTLDLRLGYHQIEIADDSKKYTAFITNEGHYEYNRMPFGLVNAPGVFQSLMNQLSAKMEPGEILTYLDDVIIPSRTIEEGLTRLEKVFELLIDFGLTLRRDKCKFLATEIEHLGFKINQNEITPGQTKSTAIKDFKQPTNQTEVRRFLGLTGFFRKFVPQYALISAPLTALLRKDCTVFRWEKEQEQAFAKLKDELVNAPTLQLYDVNAKHEVHTDACAIGLAGVLLQTTDDRTWHPVSYYSRRCTNTESKCHSYELEVLAIVETLERFRMYLLGKNFTIVTDCAAIATMKQTKELKPKVSRWWFRLLEYDFDIVHRQGSKLAHVDALSRAPVENAVEATEAGFIFRIDENIDDWLYTMQMQDEALTRIYSVLMGNLKTPQDKQLKSEYELHNHRIYRKTDHGHRFVVPKAIRWRVVEFSHDKVGHFSLNKTLERIKQKFWFPRMTKFVKEYIAACIECCYNKTRGGKMEGELHLTEIEPIPFASIHIDHLGPFVRSSRGNTHIVAISDAFTKYLVVKAVRSTKTLPVIAVINELTSYFGLPLKITTDRGTAYTSKLFEDYCNQNHIRHIKNAVRTPRANGQVERANQMILDYLRTTTTQPRNWDLHLRELQWSINTQKNTTTGFSPNKLVFDFNPRDIIKNSLTAALDENDNENMPITAIRQQALDNMRSERKKWKKRFDKAHAKPKQYQVDDLVVIQNEPASTGESRKLEPRFKGPYQITKILDNDRYLIENIPGTTNNRKFCSVYTTDKIKPWCSIIPDMMDGSTDESYIEDDVQSGVAELSHH